MTRHGSLRRRLMAVLSASILSAWAATALFTYRDAVGEIGAMLPPGEAGSDSLRVALAESIAAHLMHPLLVAIPLVGLLIWGAVHWGLAPLRALAGQVRSRSPQNLDPIDQQAPDEARPLVAAINDLLGRVKTLLDHERQFTADAAHELRTPLAAIRTHAQVAAAARTDGERETALNGVVRGTERAAHLVNQLLVLARLDAALEIEQVDLVDAATRAIADQATAAAARGTDLALDGPTSLTISGNGHLLGVLLRNLLDNAVRYGRPGGHVAVSLRIGAAGPEISVIDDGPGIAPADRDDAFRRFHRGLGSGEEGCGLGLSIARRITELHGGSIHLGDGIDGQGLSVTVRLPDRSLRWV